MVDLTEGCDKDNERWSLDSRVGEPKLGKSGNTSAKIAVRNECEFAIRKC